MGLVELRSYRWQCDYCDKHIDVQVDAQAPSPPLHPDGWKVSGSIGYTQDNWACKECVCNGCVKLRRYPSTHPLKIGSEEPSNG